MNVNTQSLEARLARLEMSLGKNYGVIIVSSEAEIPPNFAGTAIIDNIPDVDDIPLKALPVKNQA